MTPLFAGMLALALLIWLEMRFVKADPARMARLLRQAGGLALVGLGALLLSRGLIVLALPAMVAGAVLAGWLRGPMGQWTNRGRPSRGRMSRVRSATLEMTLDHDSGRVQGTVLAGPFAGRRLDDLAAADLMALYRSTAVDPDGRSLLEAYLDRRAPGWREHVQDDAAAGGRRGRDGVRGAMTQEEAYKILGVQPGAAADEIRRAHRTLMKKLHPDQGGSTYLAARVNEARDLLLGSHH